MSKPDPIYYVPDGEPRLVYHRPVTTERGTTMGFRVCECDEFVDGAADEIADALNRLPEALELLIRVAGSIRAGANAQSVADEIEEWVVG